MSPALRPLPIARLLSHSPSLPLRPLSLSSSRRSSPSRVSKVASTSSPTSTFPLHRTMSSSSTGGEGTKYRYDNGTVQHVQGGPKLSAPLGPEEAGDQASGRVDAYLNDRLADPKLNNAALARGQERAREANMPNIAITPMMGQFLTILAKSIKAERILEIGTLAGYSTAFLARALPRHGSIDTIEYSKEHARVAQKNFLDLDLFPFPTTYIGKGLELLRDPNGAFAQPPGKSEGFSDEECGYDLIFVDANKDEYFEYFLEALRLCKTGGVVVFDNAIRNGRIAVPDGAEVDEDCIGLRKIYDWVKADGGKTVLASALQTVGEKSWDGFAVVYKL